MLATPNFYETEDKMRVLHFQRFFRVSTKQLLIDIFYASIYYLTEESVTTLTYNLLRCYKIIYIVYCILLIKRSIKINP